MILPILSYGHSILRKKCIDIDKDYPELEKIINNMWTTLYSANGMGLAASQINQAVKLFIVDSKQVYDNLEEKDRESLFPDDKGIVETFIDAKITYRSEKTWVESEGCLSIPMVREDVQRPWDIEIEYLDRQFQKQKKHLSGETARAVQHEYDHTDGILYIDHINLLKRKLLSRKLIQISEGKVDTKYKMKFVK